MLCVSSPVQQLRALLWASITMVNVIFIASLCSSSGFWPLPFLNNRFVTVYYELKDEGRCFGL
jgi:hypothetical protein